MDSGSCSIADLAAIIGEHESADVRVALISESGRWQVIHGEVTLGAAVPVPDRGWRYARAAFLSRRLPASVIAALLRQDPQVLCGLKVTVRELTGNATFRRMPGQATWGNVTMPWPRTEWSITAPEAPQPRSGVLAGDGPAFLNFEAAFSSFFYAAPPGNLASQQQAWRIISADRRAWLHKVTVASDALTVAVKGTHSAGVTLELSSPASQVARLVGRRGRVRLRLPGGLQDSSLLLLRRDDEWLDYRYFHSPVPGQAADPSVTWDQPGADLSVLIAGGEGPRTEFKQEVPAAPESRKHMLKTVAAFASGEGGTILLGVTDDAQVTGISPTRLDPQMLALTSMIRDTVDPEPPYTLRTAELDGKVVMLIEVAAGGRWHALGRAKPEFYVRRGASTVPARMDEIAAGFGRTPPGRRGPW